MERLTRLALFDCFYSPFSAVLTLLCYDSYDSVTDDGFFWIANYGEDPALFRGNNFTNCTTCDVTLYKGKYF